MDVSIATSLEDGVETITLGGQLNTNAASELEKALVPVFERTHDLVFDCAALEYLASAGLRVFVATKKEVTRHGGSMRITHVCDDVREVFEITGLIGVFDVE